MEISKIHALRLSKRAKIIEVNYSGKERGITKENKPLLMDEQTTNLNCNICNQFHETDKGKCWRNLRISNRNNQIESKEMVVSSKTLHSIDRG